MQRLLGNMGIGHLRYPTAGTSSPAGAAFFVNSPYGISLAHNGNLTNSEQIADELYKSDLRHLNTSSDSETLFNILAHELRAYKNSSQLLMTCSKPLLKCIRDVRGPMQWSP